MERRGQEKRVLSYSKEPALLPCPALPQVTPRARAATAGEETLDTFSLEPKPLSPRHTSGLLRSRAT